NGRFRPLSRARVIANSFEHTMQPNLMDETTEQLTARISELEEANANLQLLDEAMRRNNALFEALLANSWQGITLTGPDRRILKVVRGLTGRSAPELRG